MTRRATTRTPHQTFRMTPTTRTLPYPLTVHISSTKQGQDTRILIATETFLDLLVDHQRVINLYTRWENRYELYGRADAVHLYSVQLAKDLNVSDVNTLNREASTIDLNNLSDETQRWLDRRADAALRFQQVVQNLPMKAMAQQARLVIGQIFTRPIRARIGEPSRVLGPSLLHRWIANAARSVDGKFQFSFNSASRDVVTPGREPRKKKDSLKRNVTWWVRSVLNGETVGQLAREYHRKLHAEYRHHWKTDKKTVNDGIQQAEALLRESPLFDGHVKPHKP